MKDIVFRIEQLLEDNKVTGYKLSKATGISESVISRVRNRKLNPSYEVLSRIAIYFNVSKHWLETGEGEKSLSSDSVSENHGFYNPSAGRGPRRDRLQDYFGRKRQTDRRSGSAPERQRRYHRIVEKANIKTVINLLINKNPAEYFAGFFILSYQSM